MTIKGNSVGHPLPDPSRGLSMAGGIDMNGYSLSGLKNPQTSDEPATKGYVDTNKVDKSNVVNNFTTTASGNVADARALKTLNDSKVDKTQIVNSYQEERAGYVLDARAMKRGFDVLNNKFNMDLLWQNGSHNSSFDGQTFTIDASPYNLFVIRYKLNNSDGYDYWGTSICVKSYRGWISEVMGSGGQTGSYTYSLWRQIAINSSGSVVFFKCYKSNKTTGTPEEDNTWLIPYQIFGIKGGITSL